MFWTVTYILFLAATVLFFCLWRTAHNQAADYELAIERLVDAFGKATIRDLSMLAMGRGFEWSQPEPFVNDRENFWAIKLFSVVSPDNVVVVNFNVTWTIPLAKAPQITLTRYVEGAGNCTDAYPITEFHEALARAREAIEGFLVPTDRDAA